MLISASRRTDLPAFYAPWLINRIRAGFCTVPNPFNAQAVARVSLRPGDVTGFVFWTRNARPLMRHLPEIDALGHRYIFQYTLIANPRALDPHSPAKDAALRTFRDLADRIGPGKIVWRYDPITFTEVTPPDHHRRNFATLTRALAGATTRCVISLLDPYRKVARRTAELDRAGIHLTYRPEMREETLGPLLLDLADMARAAGMTIVSCAEEPGLERWGVAPGSCIDAELFNREWGLRLTPKKAPALRAHCACAPSRDIGMYDGCLFGCPYCYATSSFARARARYEAHDPRSPSLFGPGAPTEGAPTAGAPTEGAPTEGAPTEGAPPRA